MLVLGVNEFLRNIRKNILAIIEMVLVYILAIFIISAFVEQISLYRGVSGFMDDTGIVAYPNAINATEHVFTEEDIKNDLIKVEYVEMAYGDVFYEDGCALVSGNALLLHAVTSNPERASYHPPLLSGKWCGKAAQEDGVIRVVVSDNFPFHVAPNQKFELEGQTFLVTGIFSSKEMVYSLGVIHLGVQGSNSYLNYYSSVEAQAREQYPYYMIADYDDMMRERAGEMISTSLVTVDFEDDITEEEMEENWEILSERYGYIKNTDAFLAKEFNDYSKTLLKIKLLPLGIVFFIVFLLSMTCLLTSGAVNVLYEKRNYAVYFITGNNWKQTIYLSVIHWVTVAAVSMILAICACMWIKASGRFDSLSLSFTGMHFFMLALITVVMLLLALLLPYRMLRNIQPVSILKDNDK